MVNEIQSVQGSLQNKVLVMTNNETNGFFDLLAKNTITEREDFVNMDNNCDGKETVTKEKSRLKYISRGYQ